MYNFNFQENEILIEIFDNILIKQNDQEITTTIALTNQRLRFLEYSNTNDGLEALRISRGVNYTRYKDIYHQINLSQINKITEEKEFYQIILNNNTKYQFYNDNLYNLLIKERNY